MPERKPQGTARLITCTCIDCHQTFQSRHHSALRCDACHVAYRRAYNRHYHQLQKTRRPSPLTPAQAAIVDKLIEQQELSDSRIAALVSRQRIWITKAGVASRRRRLGLGRDLDDHPVVVEAANIFEATTNQSGIAVDFMPAVAGEPTKAPPGTRAKVAALRRRLEAGEPLWNPGDNKLMVPNSD